MSAQRAASIALATVLTAVYGATLLRGTGHSGDTAEFQVAGHLLGTTHPTGNPGYLLLAHVATRLIPFGSVATRANLLSALCSIGALVLLHRALSRLGVAPWASAFALLAAGLTPTWWRYSIVAEVYTLHLLFMSGVFLAFLAWHQDRRDSQFHAACALYALSFGNHLGTIALLPGIAAMVWMTDRRVFVQPRRVVLVATIVALGALQYLYPLWRSRDPSTPYLAWNTPDFSSLWRYATGQGYPAGMFSSTWETVAFRRLPAFLVTWAREWGLVAPLAVWGAIAWPSRAAGAYLGGGAVFSLVLAVNYGIGDIEAYYLPVFWASAACAAVGTAALARAARLLRPTHAAAAAAVLLVAGALNWPRVRAERDRFSPLRVAAFVAAVERGEAPPSIVVAGYHEYGYLLYYVLVEGRGARRVHPEVSASVEDVRRYLVDGVPLHQRELRRRVPPGLTVYCTKGLREREFRAAGLVTRPAGWLLFEVTAPPAP